MKRVNQLKLKTKGKKNNILSFKCNTLEKEYFQKSLDKLNEIAILNFNMSDLMRMALQDLSNRIINEKIVLSLDIPERKIIYDLVPTKRN